MVGGDTFSPLAPVLGPDQQNGLCHPLPLFAVHGDQCDTEYVTFEQLLHAGFAADIIWGDKLGPARTARTVVLKPSAKRANSCINTVVTVEFLLQPFLQQQQCCVM